ncbi:MAG: type I methionyl aminopeptidase [Bacteroidetes bacterium RIFCSPLOWO2_12_FULL_37_12]|nr:MAG: type I methionyl aminopeptidase [Bacteroidetes bacterium RIFCSPLOWO2_12_FULL_37_12]
MIFFKTEEEIEGIRISCDLVSKALAEIGKIALPGVRTIELDARADEFIRDNHAFPAFKNYRGFPNSICVSVNDMVVHGIPGDYFLKEGDIVSIDCGVKLNDFFGDSAYTFTVGEINPEISKLLTVTKESLLKGIEMAVSGNRVGDIGFAVQSYILPFGYGIVRDLVGHGVGRNLHEDPEVPNYGNRGKGNKMGDGLVIAIEPMINMGTKDVFREKDGWTIKTKDGKPSAHFEHTVVVRKGTPEILTTFSYIEKTEALVEVAQMV